MNIKYLFVLLLCLPMALLSACEEEETGGSPVYIATNIFGTTEVYSNTYFKIRVDANCITESLSRLQISSFDSSRGDILLLDSALTGKNMSHEFLYKVPILAEDSLRVKITFAVWDNQGTVQRQVRYLKVIQSDYKLEEVAGITLYATEENDHFNGLNLSTLRPLVVSLADSADIDVYAYLDEENTETLSCEWRSNTDVYFTRANSFDYANATYRSVTETFGSAVSYQRVNRIQKDDVILVGRGNWALGAIKVVQLYDEPGSLHDRYIINVKRIKE